MLVKACRLDEKINKRKFWRLSTATVTITSYLTSDKSHNGSWVTRIWKSKPWCLTTNRKASDHSEQGNASQMPKRMWDITKMKATQHRIVGKAILPETSKVYTMKFSAKCMKQVPQKQRARTTRLHSTIETPSDITYVDSTETSLRASEVALCPLLPWYCVKSSWNVWLREYQHVFYLEKVIFHLG